MDNKTRTVGKQLVWQGSEGRVQVSVWEFERVRLYGNGVEGPVFVERALVLNSGGGPGVWLGLGEVRCVRALLDRMVLDSFDVVDAKEDVHAALAKRAVEALAAPAGVVGDDQRVLQFCRVLVSGVRARQEPPTGAFERAAMANVLVEPSADAGVDIVGAVAKRFRQARSLAAREDASAIRLAVGKAGQLQGQAKGSQHGMPEQGTPLSGSGAMATVLNADDGAGRDERRREIVRQHDREHLARNADVLLAVERQAEKEPKNVAEEDSEDDDSVEEHEERQRLVQETLWMDFKPLQCLPDTRKLPDVVKAEFPPSPFSLTQWCNYADLEQRW